MDGEVLSSLNSHLTAEDKLNYTNGYIHAELFFCALENFVYNTQQTWKSEIMLSNNQAIVKVPFHVDELCPVLVFLNFPWMVYLPHSLGSTLYGCPQLTLITIFRRLGS